MITNVYGQGSWPCIAIDGRRCHAELVAPDVHPLMGISTSGTILSSLSSYTSRSIKSPIPRWASRWLRLQRRPRAHQSEPASAGKSISVSPLALLSYTHPRRRPTPVERRCLYIKRPVPAGSKRYGIVRKSTKALSCRMEANDRMAGADISARMHMHVAFIFRLDFMQGHLHISIASGISSFDGTTQCKDWPWLFAPWYFISRSSFTFNSVVVMLAKSTEDMYIIKNQSSMMLHTYIEHTCAQIWIDTFHIFLSSHFVMYSRIKYFLKL